MFLYNLLILICLTGLGLNLLWNLATLKRISPQARPRRFPFVSVLVPARNEEERIGPLLESLSRQTYPSYEVLVLDDQSEDRTCEIVREATQKDPRIRLLTGRPLPAGWQGKCFACAQLAKEAQGELFLFTDADTFHAPESLTASVASLEATQADLLTIYTHLKLKSFPEKLILPLLPFTMLTSVPFHPWIQARFPKTALANGQFLLFRRLAYEAVGGHEAVREALVEDVWLARKTAASGFRLAVWDGSSSVSVQMYRNFKEIWEGFSKNIFAGFEYSLSWVTLALISSLCLYVIPYAVLILGLALGKDVFSWILLPAFQILIVFLMRLRLAHRWNLGIWSTLAHPVAILLFDAIALNSIYRVLSGRGVRWKGRSYLLRAIFSGFE